MYFKDITSVQLISKKEKVINKELLLSQKEKKELSRQIKQIKNGKIKKDSKIHLLPGCGLSKKGLSYYGITSTTKKKCDFIFVNLQNLLNNTSSFVKVKIDNGMRIPRYSYKGIIHYEPSYASTQFLRYLKLDKEDFSKVRSTLCLLDFSGNNKGSAQDFCKLFDMVQSKDKKIVKVAGQSILNYDFEKYRAELKLINLFYRGPKTAIYKLFNEKIGKYSYFDKFEKTAEKAMKETKNPHIMIKLLKKYFDKEHKLPFQVEFKSRRKKRNEWAV